MNIDKARIYEEAEKQWGKRCQIMAAVEELSEASAVLARLLNGKCSPADVVEELADAEIVLEQMRLYFNPQAIDEEKERKLVRLAGRLERKQHV